eukprot:2005560-Amphidinium_carterae.1
MGRTSANAPSEVSGAKGSGSSLVTFIEASIVSSILRGAQASSCPRCHAHDVARAACYERHCRTRYGTAAEPNHNLLSPCRTQTQSTQQMNHQVQTASHHSLHRFRSET